MIARTTSRALAAILVMLMAAAAFAQTRTLTISPVRQQPAHEQRVALVIGNSDYAQARLRNPANDARAIAAELRQVGFKVTALENADHEQMFKAIREFGDQLRVGGGVGLFYFAGHGVQISGRNYLIPVAAQIEREDEVVYRSIDAGQVLQKMETAGNRVNIVILDACRNNPFARTFRTIPTGLAVMEAPVNTLIAFATAPGAVASDGTGANGLYTEHLLKNIPQQGLRVEDMFKRVRAGVRQGSAGRQTPWENTSLEVEFYFRPLPSQLAPAPPAVAPPVIEPPAPPVIEPPAPPVIEPPALVPPPKPPAKPGAVSVDPINVLLGSEVASTAMAVSPNGGYVVSGGRDGVLSIWDVTTSKELRRLLGHAGAILAVGLSPDGRWIASGGEDLSLRIWSSSGVSELRRVRADGVVTAIAYSPNGRHLVSGDRAGAVKLWNGADGALIARFPGHSAAVRSVAFTREGRYVLSGGADGFVRVWDVSSGVLARTFGPHASEVIAARISADGASVISASADGAVWSWDMNSGRGSPTRASAAGAKIMIALSNDARSALIARDDGSTVLWDTAKGREIGRLSSPASVVTAVALSAEARLALVAADGQRIRLWSIKD